MNIRPFVIVALVLPGAAPSAFAATTAANTLAAPTQLAPPVPTAASSPAPATGPATNATSAALMSMPGARPTLGDWEDLAERQAFKDQLAKLNEGNGKTAAPAQAALPPLPSPSQLQMPAAEPPKKPRRANDACNAIGAACFYAVYGMHIDGGPDNYRGLLAIDGLVEAVYKGKRFVTPHGRYTIKDISTRELSYADARGRTHTVPFVGEADAQADPTELEAPQKLLAPVRTFTFPQR